MILFTFPPGFLETGWRQFKINGMFSCSHLLNSLFKFLLEVSKNLKEEEHLLVLNRTVDMEKKATS